MLKIFSSALVAVGFFAVTASAAETLPVVCATENPNVCVQLDFSSSIDSKTEGEFTVQVKTPGDQEAGNVTVGLYMEMGSHSHAGPPVEMAPAGPNKYAVQNAWFVMPGMWQIKVGFDIGSTAYLIQVPVMVNK